MYSSAGNIKSEIAQAASRNVAVGLRSTTALTGMGVGALGMLALLPDWVYLYESFTHLLTDRSGRLSVWNHAVALLSATGGMVGVVVAIHKWFAPILSNPNSRWYFLFAMLCLGVVTANPMIALLEKNNLIGGGIGGTGTNDMAVSGVIIQSMLFPVSAVIGTLGFGHFSKSLKDWWSSNAASRAAKRQIVGVNQTLAAEKEADLTPSQLDRLEADMKRQFRNLAHAAAQSLAQTFELYLQGKAPAPNRAVFNQQLDTLFEDAGISSKNLRDEVADAMPEMLPLEAMSADGSTLPHAAKQEVRAYIRWIKREFSRSALRAAV